MAEIDVESSEADSVRGRSPAGFDAYDQSRGLIASDRNGSASIDRFRNAFDVTLGDLAADLALDEALLLEIEERGVGGAVRFWERPEFAVVLGASGRIDDDVRRDACLRDNVAIARRSSGGGTVLIGPGALNVTVVVPVSAAGELRSVDSAQRYVLSRHAAALGRLGLAIEVSGSGDLTIAGRKCSGSAQRRLKATVMIHATILCRSFPINLVNTYLCEPKRRPSYRGERSHDEFLTRTPLDRGEIVSALIDEWSEIEAFDFAAALGRIDALVASKFADAGWVERF